MVVCPKFKRAILVGICGHPVGRKAFCFQIGFIFFGLATGNAIGIAGGLLYILMHGLAKGGLFLCAGIVEQNTKTKDITKLGGLIVSMPITAMVRAAAPTPIVVPMATFREILRVDSFVHP